MLLIILLFSCLQTTSQLQGIERAVTALIEQKCFLERFCAEAGSQKETEHCTHGP